MPHLVGRARRTLKVRAAAVVVAVAAVVGACGGGGDGNDDTAAAAPQRLEAVLATTRAVTSGHFELRRHVEISGERAVQILEGDFDRSSQRISYVLRSELTAGLRASMPATSSGDPGLEDIRLHVIRADRVVYLGPTTAGRAPEVWLRYDGPTYERLFPDLQVDLGGPLVPLLDEIAPGPETSTGARQGAGAASAPLLASAVASSAVLELGNSFLRSSGARSFAQKLQADVPLTAELDEAGRARSLTLDTLALYREAAETSGIAAVRTSARSVTGLRSELRLSKLGEPVSIAPPDPAMVRTA